MGRNKFALPEYPADGILAIFALGGATIRGMANLSDIVTSAFWRVNPPDADPAETREWLDAFDALV